MRLEYLLPLLSSILLVSGCNLFGSTPTGTTDAGPAPVDAQTDAQADASDTGDGVDADAAAEDMASDVACVPEANADFCARLGAECGGVSAVDNCGDMRTDVPCGACEAGEVCADSNLCECEPESDAELCERVVVNCGAYTDVDNCGGVRTVDCGQCSAPAQCGGGGTPNVCACPSQTDQDFCAMYGAECGAVTDLDECGQMRTVNCGSCTNPETCGGGGIANQCGCPPESDAVYCARVGGCGVVTDTDNCGLQRSADCGGCPAGEQCSNNVCACAPEDDATFCTRLSGCGMLTAVDNCQMQRTTDCGGCSDGSACVSNQCACVAESDVDFCSRLGSECGSTNGTDNCGDARTANCGTCSVAGEVCSMNACGPAFPPAGMDVWLRSDEGITLSMQGEVEMWADRVSGVVWAPPSNPAKPDVINNAHNGFDTIRFYGGQRLVRASGLTDSKALTVFVVASRGTTDREGPIVASSDATVGQTEFTYGTTADTMRFASVGAGLSFSATVLPTDTLQILTFHSDGNDFRMYQDGTETASSPLTGSGNFTIDMIGGYHTARFMRADLYEVMIWPRALSDAERTVVRNYLTNRYSL